MKNILLNALLVLTFITASLNADNKIMSNEELLKQIMIMDEKIEKQKGTTEKLKKLKQTTKKLVNTLEKDK